MYGKQFYVKKDKLVNQNQTRVPNAPLTYRQGGNFRVILKFYRGCENNVLFFFGNVNWEYIFGKIDWTEKYFFFNYGKNDSEIKFMNDMWTFEGKILKKPQS